MRIAQIRSMDISNGPGIGISLFTQSCPYKCQGCHNMSTWAVNGGKDFTEEDKDTILELVQQPHISRFSVLGGEPLLPQNVYQLADLLRDMLQERPDVEVWLWTGTTFESLLALIQGEEPQDKVLASLGWSKDHRALLREILLSTNYLIDGRFIQEKKDLTLKWRGSENQRVLDCKTSLRQGKAIAAE